MSGKKEKKPPLFTYKMIFHVNSSMEPQSIRMSKKG